MNLLDIIKATLVELDRGTDDGTVSMYAPKFTVFANEAVDEIARRFKMVNIEPLVTNAGKGPDGLAYFSVLDLSHGCKRVTNVFKGVFGTPTTPGDDPPIEITEDGFKHPLKYGQSVFGAPYISVDKRVEPGEPVWVEYRIVPTPMDVSSLTPVGTPPVATPDAPDIPEMFHALIPLYVRAREQCGQDPALQGTSNAYFSMFNQKVYNLQRETLGTPESFMFKGYHFE